jgi:uncharacterized repeat protein (TIGR01451 family)
VFRPSSVLCSVVPRRGIVGLFAAFASVALLPCGIARAATVTSDFETPLFHPGPVSGQEGWTSGTNIDEAVISSGGVPTFGEQSLRLSNLFATSDFADQTYSTPVVPPAGEDLPNTVYTAKFSVFDPAAQPGLYVTVSPDSGEGSRMAWVGLEDTGDGIEVTTSDSPKVDGAFVDYPPLAVLSYGKPHTIEFRIKLNPGPDNDQVRILIDGQDDGQCFTTWENYYRVSPDQAGPPNNGEPPNINSLQFRTSVQGPSTLAPNGGYLFDNVTVTTGTGSASPGCDITVDKQADAPTVTAGHLAGYKLTVHNRGRLAARNLLLCDRIPRRTTFVSASRKLRRIGSKRCLMIPRLMPGQRAGFHIELRVAPDAPPGTLPNIADVTPGEPPGLPPLASLPLPDLPPNVQDTIAALPPIAKVKVLVKIVRAKVTPAPPPPVTG